MGSLKPPPEELGRKQPTSPKTARADLDSTRRIFTVPAGPDSTLGQIEARLNENLLGFLREHITAGDLSPETIERDFSSTTIPKDPVFVSEQATYLMEKVVSQAVHVSSPAFIGHMTSAVPHFMLTLAKIMTALNQNLVKIETSKSFTPLERQVIAMLHRLVYDESDAFYKANTHAAGMSLGSFCSGGTVANLTCLWLARNLKLAPKENFAGVAEEGLAAGLRAYELKNLNILVSTRGHYSLQKSADVLGLGRKNVIAIPTTKSFKVDVAALERKAKALKAEGRGILAVVGVAGTTETGHIDPLQELAEVCRSQDCHFHVDAAWGGPTLFSEKYRHLLSGIEQADSVIIDAHKQLYVPVGAGIALFKEPTAARAIEHHASYIIRRGSRDLGKFTLEGSRAGLAMLVHSGLRIIARSGYELLIDLGIGKAAGFAKTIAHTRDFELVSPPETNLLTYRYVPEAAQKILASEDPAKIQRCNKILNELTIHIQKRQRSHGQTFVSRTTIEAPQYDGQALTVFRVVLANPLTTRQILASVLEEQREHSAVCVTYDNIDQRLNNLLGD